MSCIKFPASKTDLTKSSNNGLNDYVVANSKLITVANQIFGEGNWSHAITNQTLDFIDHVTGKYQAGCVSIVRVQLKDGTFHEDMGYSCSEGSSKGSAIQRARLGSVNGALKKALTCFGNETADKINRLSSRPSSPVLTETVENKVLQVPHEPTTTVLHRLDSEPFTECIPMSQTDALMGIVDLDQLFVRDPRVNIIDSNKKIKSNICKPIALESKVNVIKPTACTPTVDTCKVSTSFGITVFTNKDKKSYNDNGIKKEVDVDICNTNSSTVVTNLSDKPNIGNDIKKENKPEVSKPVVYTVMTEEEMRLERKRKQREMQEEFKRKEEIKRKCGETGSKPPPNPRY